MNDQLWYDYRYPSVRDLRKVAHRRLPQFAWDYLEGGANEDEGLAHNQQAFKKIKLEPHYIKTCESVETKVDLFGRVYDAPMGVAPIGFQDMMWPQSPKILIQAAVQANVPVVTSTVTTISLEKAASLSEGKAWFQLYQPKNPDVQKDLMQRIHRAGYQVLVYTIDIPSVTFRPDDIKNGLGIPPRVGPKMFAQAIKKPYWCLETLKHGLPTFENFTPYLPKNPTHLQITQTLLDKQQVTFELLKRFRDEWKGVLILKGVMSLQDAQRAYEIGADGIVVSNHGARQFDAGLSPLEVLGEISQTYGHQMTILFDSGIRSGVDIAKALAVGAKAVLVGRPLMYGVATLGKKGGTHTINILKVQLKQVLEQIRCQRLEDLNQHLIQL